MPGWGCMEGLTYFTPEEEQEAELSSSSLPAAARLWLQLAAFSPDKSLPNIEP